MGRQIRVGTGYRLRAVAAPTDRRAASRLRGPSALVERTGDASVERGDCRSEDLADSGDGSSIRGEGLCRSKRGLGSCRAGDRNRGRVLVAGNRHKLFKGGMGATAVTEMSRLTNRTVARGREAKGSGQVGQHK